MRDLDAATCERYLETQAMWWRAFGQGRCLIVGDSARGQGQGECKWGLNAVAAVPASCCY